ncbi:MAG: peptidoglycan-associated lipoprotein Pal [Syntrophaceae bacterium]|nr:peptidoglycan-associated lipoprotein Pal [Syntrophaceae bacterium]
MFAGCAEKKAVVKEGAAQEVTSGQASKGALTGEQAVKEEKEQAVKAADVIKDIYFDFDKSNIRTDAREVLKTNADWFLKNSNVSIIIEGHCDERGTAEYNMALGQRRADEAKKYLVNLGVNGAALKTISYGKERPVDPGHNEEAWAKNRRDHFVVKDK